MNEYFQYSIKVRLRTFKQITSIYHNFPYRLMIREIFKRPIAFDYTFYQNVCEKNNNY